MAYRIKDPKLNEFEAMQWTCSEDELDIAEFLGEGYDIDGSSTTLKIRNNGRFAPDEFELDDVRIMVPPYWWLIIHPLLGLAKMEPEIFNEYMETCKEQEEE